MDEQQLKSICQQLPSDIVFDILTLLPVKTLLRFKSACKRWYNLIKDPIFIDSHVQRSQELILDARYSNHPRIGYTFNFYSLDQDCELSRVFPGDITCQDRSITSCNGLLCFTTEDREVKICNPATTETMTLPKPNFFTKEIRLHRAAIGYDSYVRKYKVVILVEKQGSPIIGILTLGDESWRMIDVSLKSCVSFILAYSPSVVYANGALHWFPCYAKQWGMASFISFSFAEENFRVTPVPPEMDMVHHKTMLREDQGCPCLVELVKKNGSMIAWRLMNNEKQEWASWRILLPVKYNSWDSNIVSIRNDEVAMHHAETASFVASFVCYNESGQVIKSVQICSGGSTYQLSFGKFHKASVVSIRDLLGE